MPASIRILVALVPTLCAAQSNETTHDAALTACNQLAGLLGSSLVQTSGPSYETAIANAWNLQNAEFQPTCIVFPTTSSHVQVAMKAVYDAKSHYAVQSGSHSAMKGWNTVQEGVLIDFKNMRNASYDPVRDSIILEPGVHWQEAVAALEPFGVAPVGGRVGDVGTGLLLGGGLSWLSPSQGYAADNFKELDVVLVNGSAITVTATNAYSDLFRALKGGGNRFGIVTRYELSAVHTGTKDDQTWFGGQMIFDSSAEALMNATARYVREVDDPKAVILVSMIYIVAGEDLVPVYLVVLFYNGPNLPTDIFGDFLSIPSVSSDLGPRSYFDVAGILGLGNERGFVQHFGASALVGEENLFLDAFNHWTNFSTAYKDNFNTTTLAFTPIPDSQIQAGRAKGGNIINAPGGGFAAVQIYQQFKAGINVIPADVKVGIDRLFKQIPPSPGLPLYVGECDSDQKVFESYGDYELLKRIYSKYDPERFNVKHSLGPGGL
ncbi:FAD-binding domain-containing protein [Mycena albidolilacea]|uniref:FAD-binding domain-containing protein n=1 Tax=Mycena albidolilacea TaxID=1033008 RepID=A0AAD7EM41_9AGAR|nr:FAD-binding domain-containing protein [Mycena albidolilacea]